ncbi:MAG: hypothetical protein GY826_14775, partial [Fuerstiella sp.]|nr:hypothetical protein [Fuerstiella sp.]
MNLLRVAISLLLTAIALSTVCAGDESTLSAGDVQFFESRIRPALVKHCYECHAADAKEVGGKLLLDSRDTLLKGGESGAAVVAGKPDESLIIHALRYDGVEMPPEKPLPEAVVHDFVEWVKRGAPYPRTAKTVAQAAVVHDPESLWAYEPPKNPSIPIVQNENWARDSLDNFVLAKIEAAGLQPTED